MKLVIVESPTKAKTIAKFLGGDYAVESSYGHIRDLPKTKLGIDVEHEYEPQYVTMAKAKPVLKKLKDALKKSDAVILATDEDREGEAIAWHLAQALGLGNSKSEALKSKQIQKTKSETQNVQRIVFHEITKPAIAEALTRPRALDMNLVNAQQARRVLDRLVGYKLSPFLWKKVAKGLSAGRVQSVAVRLIVEREREIRGFKPEEYWTIVALLKTGGAEFEAALASLGDTPLEKFGIPSEAEARSIARDLEAAAYTVASVTKKTVKKNPLPPFITSTLQQEAAKRLGYSSKKTMLLAQRLYENGYITYMRTDSVNLSAESLHGAKRYLEETFGAAYASDAPRVFKTKSRLAQEAHEAIRPSRVTETPETIPVAEIGEKKLYTLIWRRFLASQMPQAVFDATTVEIAAASPNGIKAKRYTLKANGAVIRFDGFLKVWQQKFKENELPPITEHATLELASVKPGQHFTEPPPRFNEASLIKILEEFGIGRPSTYAPIISVIQLRNYVKKEQGKFYPTEIGELVNNVLTENFPEVVDIDFTAKMEDTLDSVADGKERWQDVIGAFYVPFAKNLETKYAEVKKTIADEPTNEVCEKCGKPMVIKFGRFGKFMACSGFPECKNTKQLAKEPPKLIGMKCPECLASPDPATRDAPGDVVERRVGKGRARGKIFWGCSRYPACKFATWENPLNPEKEKPANDTQAP
ncbi:MAG: type I DNA topoisomerase [Candidatus Harrisonbacteria bacterium]|nr:type I DNA topoisomerase [Candidatus Harrisonbacteria bacterium]